MYNCFINIQNDEIKIHFITSIEMNSKCTTKLIQFVFHIACIMNERFKIKQEIIVYQKKKWKQKI